MNITSLQPAIKARYKERIEFEYDLIVAIAKDNATKNHVAVEDALKAELGREIPVTVDLTTFSKHKNYLTLDPADQVSGRYITK